MKTAISIPDNIFNKAEVTAKQLGLARSQLYVRAIEEFIDHHNKESITKKLNVLYEAIDTEKELMDAGLDTLREATEHDSW